MKKFSTEKATKRTPSKRKKDLAEENTKESTKTPKKMVTTKMKSSLSQPVKPKAKTKWILKTLASQKEDSETEPIRTRNT